MKLCKEDRLVNIFESMEGISISTIKVKIWQVFLIYKANWNPRPLPTTFKISEEKKVPNNYIYCQILARQEEIPQKTSKNISRYFCSSFQGHV